jgi:Domain of unknown function (DUF4157)
MKKQTTTQKIQLRATPGATGILQRKCACGTHTTAGGECDSCGKKKGAQQLQRSAISNEPMNEAPPIVHEVLRSSGQPLDESTRAFFEPRFGHDFSRVRVHTDASAAASARAVNALAYTVGTDIAFKNGQPDLTTNAGKQLLAHELAHVVQQGNHASLERLAISQPNDAHEQEADQMAHAVIQVSGNQGFGPHPVSESVRSQADRFIPKSVATGLSRQAAVQSAAIEIRNCLLPSGQPDLNCLECVNTATNQVIRTIVKRVPCQAIPKLQWCWECQDSATGTVISVVHQDPKSGKFMLVYNMKAGSEAAFPSLKDALQNACNRKD